MIAAVMQYHNMCDFQSQNSR